MLKFSKGAGDNKLTFPLTQEQIDNLKPCGLHSPRVGHHHGIELPDEYKTVEGLDSAAREVAEVVAKVSRGEFPRYFFEKYYPKEWGYFPQSIPEPLKNEGLSFENPQTLSNAVWMDLPTDMPFAVLKWLISKGYRPDGFNEDCIDFLELIPESIEKVTNAVRRNLEKSFEVKYYYGIPRPEEVLGYNLTLYPEGCPNHPSFPAGHGAACAAVSVLISRFNVNDDEGLKVIRDCAYIWAMSRSLAGVHYPLENLSFVTSML